MNVFDTQKFEGVEECFAALREAHGCVVREVFFDQDMSIETGEIRDPDDADTAETFGVDIQAIALGDIAFEAVFGTALQTEEGNGTGFELAFERAACDVRGTLRVFNEAVHDELIFHGALLHAAGGGVAAVKAHEEVLFASPFEIGF